MELFNELHAQEPLTEGANPAVIKKVFEMMVLMVAPITPHISEELWEMLGKFRRHYEVRLAGLSRGSGGGRRV